MTEKEKTYLLTITILEGRHYIWENMNSAVIVAVENKKKCTAVSKYSDCPYYNEYFVFELDSTYEKLLEKNITITVIQPKTFCRRRKILGVVKLDIATVLNQRHSQFYHKWAVLASPKADMASGPTGYLKIDISVLSRGQIPKLPVNIVNDEIEGNLLTPMGFVSERQRAQFIFEIYKCDNLHSKSTQFIDSGPNKTNNNAMETKFCSFVEVTFAGFNVRTSIKKNTQSPVFNERLTITDLFPPLCQRFKIEICLDGMRKTVQSLHLLNLKSISNDTVEGFLPTFGPSYIYLYSKVNLEGYCGTILLSMKTELLDNTVTTSAGQKANIQHGIEPLPEEQIFSFEETFLFATILEANCISKKYHDKQICFRLTFGNITSETEMEGATGDGHPSNVTVAQKPLKTSKRFYFMNYAEEKPCLRIKSKWPDFRKRMYNSNMLDKISKDLKSRLGEVEELFMKHNPTNHSEIEEKLMDAIDVILSSAKKYVEIISTNYNFDYGTVLDKERINMCVKIMNVVINRAEDMLENKSKKFLFRKLEDIQKKLESLVEDAQACWPDVFLWMTSANKKVGYIRIPARDIVFSQVPEEMGENCGKIRPMLFLIKEKNQIICKVEILLWLGLEKQKQECLNVLPSGFKYEGRLLMAEEKHLFQGKAYIFEGEVQPGFDPSGLVDAFVQVSLGKEMKETQVKNNVLVPLWDQTLTFHNIYLYGTKDHIKANPPTILVEMFDEDPFKTDFIGRDIIKPEVKYLEELPDDTQEISNSSTTSNARLKIYLLYNQDEILGKVLAGFELIEISQSSKMPEEELIVAIPAQIKPNLVPHKIEVMFWGVRHLKKINLIRINRPRITFSCANKFINSSIIENAKKFSNFSNHISSINVNIPSQIEYSESFIFKLFDSRKFGIYVFAGISISNTTPFLCTPLTVEERQSILSGTGFETDSLALTISSSEMPLESWSRTVVKKEAEKKSKLPKLNCWKWFSNMVKNLFKRVSNKNKLNKDKSGYSLLSVDDADEDEEDYDWWTKFYASMDTSHKDQTEILLPSQRNTLKIYACELERHPEFQGFSDILTTFDIFKGQRTGDEALDEQHTTAIFKGAVKIYRWPPEDGEMDEYVTPMGTFVKDGILSSYPDNSPIQYVLRVYCVRGINLRPKDLSGKADPFLEVKLGDKRIYDQNNYIVQDINPIFGRCFEFQASFPEYTSLIIRIYDYDMASANDLIGETKIDLENRYYTRHRAFCGIAESYYTSGYCQWRDQKKPTEILLSLCKTCGTALPEYKSSSVNIGSKEYFATNFRPSDDPEYDREVLALATLHRWNEHPLVGCRIVPEHVETRSLFIPEKPGIEQGKLQLWIDLFPRLEYPVPEKVNITPRKPVSYELRVVIWNCEEVTLAEDDFFSGEKKSDIYVKGFLGEPSNCQYTDVHYRSLTGEGNFNWRFVFPFAYLSTENKLVVRRKESVFSSEETELKMPCVLNLTVWDNDTFSKDDFLGSLILELSRMPRGARSAKKCDLSILEPTAKKISLFKIRRSKGWWPFRALDPETKEETIGGKLEAELEIVTIEEAEKNPAGLGRQGPQPLAPPKRPDTSFSWFRNPLKSCKHVVCTTWKWKILKGCAFIFLGAFVALGIYSLPGAVVQKLRDRLHRYSNHGLDFDEEIPKFFCHPRNPFKDSKCIYCRGDKSKDCKIFFAVLIMVLLISTVVLGLYFGGYITYTKSTKCIKAKRESYVDVVGVEDDFI